MTPPPRDGGHGAPEEWLRQHADTIRVSGRKERQERSASRVDPAVAEFLSADHWLERKLEPPEPLLGEAVTKPGRLLMGGATGLGKTQLAMAMAEGMVTGRGFAHWKASRPCRVLYLDGEMARDLVQERLADLRRRMGGTAWSRLFVLSTEDVEEMAARFPGLGELAPLNTEAGRVFLLNLTDALGGVDAVFFDNRMSLLCGDMKEEQPWSDTMPLVKELSRRRIAQVWVDHAGHNAGQLYGTKTKEWQMDSVALLSEPEEKQEEADIAFTLKFTKARRRKPANRTDFATVTFALANEEWSWTLDTSEANAAAARSRGAGARKLTPTEQGWLKDIQEVFAEPDLAKRRRVPPLPGTPPGPEVLSLTRDQLRDGLIRRERLEPTPDGPLTGAMRTKLYTGERRD